MKNFRLVLKNVATIVVCFAVMTFAVSCGDDDETVGGGDDNETGGGEVLQTVEIEVANLPAGVTVAKLMVYDRDGYEYVEIASANLAAGKFTIILPPTLDPKYLLEAGSVFGEQFGYTVNNKGAKIIEGPDMVRFDGFNDAGDYIGEFYYRNSTGTVWGFLGYADADVLITGRFEFGDHVGSEVHLDIKTGWNWYYSNGEEEKTQTETPAGVALAWYFDVYAEGGEDPQTVVIEVADLPAEVTVAKLMVYDRDYESEYIDIASANLVDGKFTIILPPSLDPKYLVEAGSFFHEDYGYTVNNKGAKIIEGPDMVRFDGFNEAGDYIGEFYYRNSTSTVGGYLGYADADVLITGRFESGDYVGSVFHFDFKTGWNWYYSNGEEEGKNQTDAPAGVSLAWYFEIYAH